MKKAYLQKCGDSKTSSAEYLDDFVMMSREPLIRRGYDIVIFDDFKPIQNFSLDKTDIIVGTVESTIEHINFLKPNYSWNCYPTELFSGMNEYYFRNIYKTTLKEYKANFVPKFIKPLKTKLFTGFYCKDYSYIAFCGHDTSDTEEIWVCDKIDFLSEWRLFVNKGKIVGSRNYSEDPMIFPDRKKVEMMIRDYKSAPISYTIDVGIIEREFNGKIIEETVLIETNDFWATGGYGLDGRIYVDWILDGWREISKN